MNMRRKTLLPGPSTGEAGHMPAARASLSKLQQLPSPLSCSRPSEKCFNRHKTGSEGWQLSLIMSCGPCKVLAALLRLLISRGLRWNSWWTKWHWSLSLFGLDQCFVLLRHYPLDLCDSRGQAARYYILGLQIWGFILIRHLRDYRVTVFFIFVSWN